MNKNLIKTSKFMSLVLRHKPEEIGLSLDENGWAMVDELLEKTNHKGIRIDLDMLKEIVDTNEKKRFTFNEDFSKIRANQGHSIHVDVELKPVSPPDKLFHGTAKKSVEQILKTGLKKMSRLHVHMCEDHETAIKVGQRHGEPIVLKIDSKTMSEEGIQFFLSENGVWLVDSVPAKYLSKNAPNDHS